MKKLLDIVKAAVIFAALAAGAGTANAAIFTPGTQDAPSPPGNNFPRWYTEPAPPAASGQSLAPCLSKAPSPTGLGPMCVLLADAVFIPANPIVFPTNYPQETFYFVADALIDFGAGNKAKYRSALEGGFSAGVVQAGQQITFVRDRFTIDAPVSGTYRITHPWGQKTIPNVVAGPAAIKIQEDIGIGTPGGPFVPIDSPADPATQTGGHIQRFLVASGAPGGAPRLITIGNEVFIGDPNIDQNVTGATQPNPNDPLLPFNSFMVEVDTGAGFVLLGQKTDNFKLAGSLIGLILSPPAGGTDFSAWKLNNASTPKTFAVQNLSANPVTPVISAIVPGSNNVPSPEFSIAASAASPCGGPLAAGASCNFDVVFNTATAGAKSATINVSGGGVPAAQATVTGAGDNTPPVALFTQITRITKLTSQTVSGTVTDDTGVASVQVRVNGIPAAAPTVANGTWSVNLTGLTPDIANQISVTATDIAQPAPGNTSTPNVDFITVDTIAPAVAIDAVPATVATNSQLITGTASDAVAVSSVAVSVNGTLQGLATVTGTTAATWSFTVTNLAPTVASAITATATDTAGNQSAPTAASTITFVPPADGNMDLSVDNKVTIADALMALRSAVNLFTPTAEQKSHGDVAPLDPVTGVPNPDGVITIADALIILKKVVGLITTF